MKQNCFTNPSSKQVSLVNYFWKITTNIEKIFLTVSSAKNYWNNPTIGLHFSNMTQQNPFRTKSGCKLMVIEDAQISKTCIVLIVLTKNFAMLISSIFMYFSPTKKKNHNLTSRRELPVNLEVSH